MSQLGNFVLALSVHTLEEANKRIEAMARRIKELEAELAEARRAPVSSTPTSGVVAGWFLERDCLSDAAANTLNNLIQRAKACSICDVDLRENGRNVHFEADWIKYMKPVGAAPSHPSEAKSGEPKYVPEYKTVTDHNGKVTGVEWVNADQRPAVGAKAGETGNA